MTAAEAAAGGTDRSSVGRRRGSSFPPVTATGESPLFYEGDKVRISDRRPVGHYRVPLYLRGRTAIVEALIPDRSVNNEEEGFGRNAGCRRHYYRLALPLSELWAAYAGSAADGLRIEVFETWLERIEP